MEKVIYLNKKEVLYATKTEDKVFHRPNKKYSAGDYRNVVTYKWGLFKKIVKEYVPADLYYYSELILNPGRLTTMPDLIKHIEQQNGSYVYFNKEDQIFYYKPELNIYFTKKSGYLNLRFESKSDMEDFIKLNGLDCCIKEETK